MDIEQDVRRKIVVAVATVVVFVLGAVAFGARIGGAAAFGSTGGLVLVAGVALFVLAIAAIGLALGD